MDQPSEQWMDTEIRSDGVAAEDPLNDLARRFSPEAASSLDREALLLSDQYEGKSPAALAADRRSFSGQGASTEWEIAYSVWDADRRERDLEEALLRASENLQVIELTHDADDHEAYAAQLDSAEEDIAVCADDLEDARDRRGPPDDSRSFEAARSAAAHWLAIARVQAIAGQLAIRDELGADSAGRPDPSMPFREIGPDVDLSALEAEKAREAAIVDRPRRTERRRIQPAPIGDELRRIIGADPDRLLSKRAELVAEWIQAQPGWFVQMRSRELSGAPEQTLDGSPLAQRLALEAELGDQLDYLGAAQAEADRLASEGSDQLDGVLDDLERYERSVDRIETSLADLHSEPASLEAGIDAVLAAAYHDELQLRIQVQAERDAALAVADPSSELQKPMLVGRGDVYVEDPFAPYAAPLGPAAQRVHDRMLVIGKTLPGLTDAELEQRSLDVGKPFDGFDEQGVMEGLKLRAEERLLEEAVLAAQERAHLVEHGFVSDDVSPRQHARDVESAWNEVGDARQDVTDFQVDTGENLDRVDARSFLDAASRRDRVTTAFAVAREQAFRARRAELLREPSLAAALPTDAILTEIGTGDISQSEERLRVHSAEVRERVGLPGAARLVERHEVTVPNSLDPLEVILGKERVADIMRRGRELKGFVERAPDALVAERHRTLGAPEKLVNPEARHALYIERKIATSEAVVSRMVNEADFVGSSDPEFAERSRLDARAVEYQLWADERKLERLQKEGPHPDGELQLVGNKVVEAGVWANEAEFRRLRGIAQEVERSIASPSPKVEADLEALVGPAFEPGSELADKRTEVIRQVETDRLSRESAAQHGLEPPAPMTPLEVETLHEQVNELRAAHNMPQLEQGPTKAIGSGIER